MNALGGKQQMGLAVNPLNNPVFNQYKKDLAALCPIDSAEKAAKYRELFQKGNNMVFKTMVQH